MVFARPLDGYSFGAGSRQGQGWRGTAALPPALRAQVEGQTGWRREPGLGAGDGQLFRRGDAEASAFDDPDVLAKMAELSGLGTRRFVLWLLGARLSLAPFCGLAAPDGAGCPPAERR